MKKRNLLLFALLLVVVACTEEKKEASGEKGSLYITSMVTDVEITTTRAEADVNQFTVILEHETDPAANLSGLFSSFPNGVIDDMPVGYYTLTLTSHPDGFTPAFNDPWYQGVRSKVQVTSGTTTMVTVECVQANAGITFTYDPSLEAAGLGDIVPEMRQDDTTLYFEGQNREGKAYFMPGQVELKIKHGDTYLSIGGQESQILNVSKEQLWQATLKASQITGKLSIVATVRKISEPTNFIEFSLGEVETVQVEGLEITSNTASFFAKGKGIEAVKFGVFATTSVDYMVGIGTSLESILDSNGNELGAPYLAQLNSEEGLVFNFDGMQSETAYTFLLMSVKDSTKNAQRYDFITTEGIKADPVQDPDGPITPGTYTLNIYQGQADGVYTDPYENQIVIKKAVQENLYIVNNLFLIGDLDLIASYDESQGKLTFTGKDINGYEIFNDIAFDFNDGQLFAGIYLTDGTNPVETLVFNVVDHKLSAVPVVMEFHTFDPLTEEDLGWQEISPLNNPFAYQGAIEQTSRDNTMPVREVSVRSFTLQLMTHSASVKEKGAVYATVSVLR